MNGSPGFARREPWAAEDLVRWLVTVTVAGILCVGGWWRAREADDLADLSGAVVGLVGLSIALGGHILWFLRSRRSIGQRLRCLMAALDANRSDPPSTPGQALLIVPDDDRFVGGQGLRFYHRPTCPAAEGRAWPPASRAEQEQAGRIPCGRCRP